MSTVKIIAVHTIALLVLMISGAAKAGALEDAKAALARKDYTTALRLFRPLAEQGDAVAQCNLGYIYGIGLGSV